MGVLFHDHGTTTLDLSWVAGSQRLAVPKGVFAALVQRVDAGTGDVSLVCESRSTPRRPAGGRGLLLRSVTGGSDPVEEVQEALGQRLVAAGVAAVDAAERGEHHAAGVEVDHRGQVSTSPGS